MTDRGDELITLESYIFLGDAELALATLEAADIPAVLADDNMSRLGTGGAHAHGGIRLRVQRRNEEEAREVLAMAVEERLEESRHLEPNADRCKCCFSEEVYRTSNRVRVIAAVLLAWPLLVIVTSAFQLPGNVPLFIMVAILLASIVAVIIGTRKKCRSCGLEWR